MATRSMPIVSNFPSFFATRSLVPVPSVVVMRTGSRKPSEASGSAAEKPPMPGSTARERMLLMKSTNRSPRSMSTPASLYDFTRSSFQFFLLTGASLTGTG